MDDAQSIVDRMKSSTNSHTNTSLASVLKVGGSTIRTWVVRDSVPLEKCMFVSSNYGISIEWILTGKGSKDENNDKKINTDEIKNSIMEGLFTAIQIRAITTEDGVKIEDVADIIMKELKEKQSKIFSEKANKAS